jgi:hypothetical protein
MRFNKVLVPGALALALSVSAVSAEAGQSGRRPNRNSGGGGSEQRGGEPRGGGSRDEQRGAGDRNERRRADGRNDQRDTGDRDDQPRERAGRAERRSGPVYVEPRRGPVYVAPRRVAPSRNYGRGPGLSVYFSIGSGYRYGSPYYGPVYGYSVPSSAYGPRRNYGELRLHVRPSDAAVYVDGYYAGIVDDFDGVFQRLTLEVGPHRVEVEAPGYETRVYDVYVDPTRTLDLRGDLYPQRP